MFFVSSQRREIKNFEDWGLKNLGLREMEEVNVLNGIFVGGQ